MEMCVARCDNLSNESVQKATEVTEVIAAL